MRLFVHISATRLPRLTASVVVLALPLFCAAEGKCADPINVVLTSGVTSPDGNGVLALGSAPSINDAGQMAFVSSLTGTIGGTSDTALFRRDASGITLVARTGQTVGGKTITGFIPSVANIASSGTLSAVAAVSPSGALNFLGDGNTLTPLCAAGSSSPSGSNSLLGVTTAVVNEVGVAAYVAAYTGGNPEVGLYQRDANGTVTTRLLRNATAPRGGTITSLGTRLSMNASGQFAATLDVNGTATDSLARIDGSGVHELIRQGDLAADGLTTLGQFSSTTSFVTVPLTQINGAGQIAFAAQYNSGIRVGAFLADDSGAKMVVPGSLPQGTVSSMNVLGISSTGRVAVEAEFTGGSDPLSGIYIGDSSGQTAVAIEDTATPTAGKFFRRFFPDGAAVNDAGQLVFLAELSDTANGPLAGRGLFFYDPVKGLQQIARTGDALASSTITDVFFSGTMVNTSSPAPDRSHSGMNANGNVAFMFQLQNGQLGIGLWSANPVLGDFDRDGQLTATDIPAMLSALTDLNAYAAAKSLSATDLAALGDFSGDGSVTNRDIQGLLDAVASHGLGAQSVPEPYAIELLAMAIPAMAAGASRHVRRKPAARHQ